MATVTLLSLFPKHEDLLAVAPEDLAGVIIELMPPLLQNGMFNPASLIAQLYEPVGASYPPGSQRDVYLAIAEAISWLITRGLFVADPGQPSPGFYVPTRRAQNLRTRVDVEAFQKGRILPDDLIPVLFAEKVVPLFRRGDHDIAVFQALIGAEREAEMHLFAAAIGHAKNPASHRDFAITAREAARLIIFASYLFDVVERRAQ
jgi:hypothetical protein